MDNSTFYSHDYSSKYGVLYNPNIDPLEYVVDWAHTQFSYALHTTNNKSQVKGLANRIQDKEKFNDLLENDSWNSAFKEYCYEIFIHRVLAERISTGHYRSYSIQRKMEEVMEDALAKCDRLFSYLSEDLSLLKIDEDIKEFHMTYVEICAKQAQQAAWEDQSEILEMLALNQSKETHKDTAYNLEKFISSNEES